MKKTGLNVKNSLTLFLSLT